MAAAARGSTRAARRGIPTTSDENDAQFANRSTRQTESYAWSHYASAEAFRTPDHDSTKHHHQHERHDDSYDWHYQETPPARTKHAYSGEEALGGGFKTPEPGVRRHRTAAGASEALPTTTTSAGASPEGETQQFQTAAEFAQSQYKRRNRLEKRLEELQKDVASLTMKLRSSSNRSTSTGYVSVATDMVSATATKSPAEFPLPPARENRQDRAPLAEQSQTQGKLKPPPSPVVKIKKNRLDKPRMPRSNLSEHSTTPTKGRMANHVSISTMRELHKVTTERDQLRFELEKTKRTLTSTEKKCEEALKVREAYEKLKAHCESLQESLDLSEKIRVRQKKLLHQLQQNQLQQQQSARPSRSDAPSAPKMHKEPTRTSAAAKPTQKTESQSKIAVRDSVYRFPSQYPMASEHIQYDILDSLVDSSEPNGFGGQRGFSRDKPVTTRPSRSRAPVSSQSSKQPRGAPTYADFDSLLQKVHSPHPYTITKSSRVKHQEPSRISRRDQANGSTGHRARSEDQNQQQSLPGTHSSESPANAVATTSIRMSALESLVEKTYQALLTVVQITALSRKVLFRPPFTFLHKLLVETLADYDIFTYQQLEFAKLVTKEDKAAFLTRAIAFVTFAMANINDKRISCLLLVSPIKVLAGVAVEDTHEFLLQLCEVCKSPDREAKDAAAHDVVAKGDAQLYTSGVTFRKGLLLIQAIVRSFIKRRIGKRKLLQNGTRSSFSAFLISMNVGTRFLKELADGRYEHDTAARDEVDEIEMKIILEESHRLNLLKERMTSKASTADDADILLTGLPDLSLPLNELEPTIAQSKPKLVKRVSSRDSSTVLTPHRSKPSLSQSQCIQPEPSVSFVSPVAEGGSAGAIRREKMEPTLARLNSNNDETNEQNPESPSLTASGDSFVGQEGELSGDAEKPWQASLKKMLAIGQDPESRAVTPLAKSLKKLAIPSHESALTPDVLTSKSANTMRNEAQRDQLKKELSHAKKAPMETKPSAKFSAFTKFRQRICDEFKSADVGDYGSLSASQLRSILLRLDIPGVDETLIDGLIERALAVGSTASSSSAADSSSLPTTSASPASAGATPNLSGMVYYNQLCRVLENLEWSGDRTGFGSIVDLAVRFPNGASGPRIRLVLITYLRRIESFSSDIIVSPDLELMPAHARERCFGQNARS
ncbi:Calcium-binding protein cml8, partial [Globisporangium splendens]